jgi:hypothetical protein
VFLWVKCVWIFVDIFCFQREEKVGLKRVPVTLSEPEYSDPPIF